ncbi:hypothetical protein AB0K12_35665 [Nonomuraea sp. NPDC049419]|uniref:hypothetical protein n=1 Tax=Nonomuraea sp. NPDC049419 TaxID=3155772 RepID=UPI00341FAB55
MREPEPTAADQWSTWPTEPEPPRCWPGLGDEHRGDGFHIDRKGVKSVAGQIVGLSFGMRRFDGVQDAGPGVPEGEWLLPYHLGLMLSSAAHAVDVFWRDLHAEVGVAGLLIERASSRYDLADDPKLGDVPDSTLKERLPITGDRNHLSDLYPNGSIDLKLPGTSYDVGHLTASQAQWSVSTLPSAAGAAGMIFGRMPEPLVDVANLLLRRAQDLRDAPWYGAAADRAQGVLRQIYANATALAAVSGRLDAAARSFVEISDWCRKNFERVADPDRGVLHETFDFGGTPDSRARDFLARANSAYMEVYDSMPKRIAEDLPGLQVTDRDVGAEGRRFLELRLRAEESLADNLADGPQWWVDHEEVFEGRRQAEKEYG